LCDLLSLTTAPPKRFLSTFNSSPSAFLFEVSDSPPSGLLPRQSSFLGESLFYYSFFLTLSRPTAKGAVFISLCRADVRWIFCRLSSRRFAALLSAASDTNPPSCLPISFSALPSLRPFDLLLQVPCTSPSSLFCDWLTCFPTSQARCSLDHSFLFGPFSVKSFFYRCLFSFRRHYLERRHLPFAVVIFFRLITF